MDYGLKWLIELVLRPGIGEALRVLLDLSMNHKVRPSLPCDLLTFLYISHPDHIMESSKQSGL
jgi:hypothetical protein